MTAKTEAMTKVKVLKQEVEDATKARSSMAWAREAAEGIRDVEKLHTTHVGISEDRQRLVILAEDLSEYGSAQKNRSMAVKLAENALTIGESWSSVRDQRIQLDGLVTQVQSQQAVASREIPDVAPLIGLREAWSKTIEETNELGEQIEDVENIQNEVRVSIDKAEKSQAQFKEKMGKVCPLCGNKL